MKPELMAHRIVLVKFPYAPFLMQAILRQHPVSVGFEVLTAVMKSSVFGI
jgi:hypothetical protein